ncbi:alpha-glucosidase MalA [Acidianus sp. HS-5]|uniref:alpha-glucosidase MalA n=1 Tax=Acidianus sp. HS-5 TaxID=2886040 RepID=UPI001F27F05A|nr:alpha-glucosidase MalA [Acidianus sp. HS-5]BDC17312.1 alpha-glucosidase [Acidianus sp. HS-5]
MKLLIKENKGICKISVNDPFPPVDFPFNGRDSEKDLSYFSLNIKEDKEGLLIEKDLDVKEHVLGLGEKAYELDRRRGRFIMYNVDAGAYDKFDDPLYLNIPFIITVKKGVAKGIFVNSASKLVFDIGVEDYGKIKIKVPEPSVEIYFFEGPTIEKVLEQYSEVTGKPFLPPYWAFGYMISRYSYFPQDKIIELLDELRNQGFKVMGLFLDIDYMDSFKLFTWNKERFPDPKKFLDEVHSRGVKVITIVDHSVKADQSYDVFISGLGKFCETSNGELFVGKLWPGNCVYPDFFREDTRKWWINVISEWLSQGIDGIWLDMNEPTDFTRVIENKEVLGSTPLTLKDDRMYYTFPEDVVHELKGKKVPHSKVRNAYPYYEAMATFEGFKDKEVFILSRSGYAGIQKFAFVWTGDNTASKDQLILQLQTVLGLSISGVPYVGIDIGGFQGRLSKVENSPEILLYMFRLAMFFPFFRTHKAKDGIDVEPIYLPSYYKEKVKDVINTRYKFLPYMYCLAKEAHETGHPVIRPLFYEFPEDEDTYKIEDEYMLGKYVLYAPQLGESRLVYLPGKWFDFFTGEERSGWVRTNEDLPIYIRENAVITLDGNDLIIVGNSKLECEIEIEKKGNIITFSKPYFVRRLIINKAKKVIADEKEVKTKEFGSLSIVELNKEVKKVELVY